MTELPEDLDQQMHDAAQGVCHRMADDLEQMAGILRDQSEDLEDNADIIVANLYTFIGLLAQGTDHLSAYCLRDFLLGLSEEHAESMDQEMVEAAMHTTAEQLEDLIAHIGKHVPAEEWYSLVYDLTSAISFLQIQVTGLRQWSKVQELERGPSLDDSQMYGKMIWRNPDAT